MTVALLILHGLIAVALLGAISHQLVSALAGPAPGGDSFLTRYRGTRASSFSAVVVALYLVNCCVGAWLYPTYRLDVRIPFEEMRLGWAIGLFELKEHFAGLGLGLLPAYLWVWRAPAERAVGRRSATATLAFVIWWDFLAGHILNNIRGLQ